MLLEINHRLCYVMFIFAQRYRKVQSYKVLIVTFFALTFSSCMKPVSSRTSQQLISWGRWSSSINSTSFLLDPGVRTASILPFSWRSAFLQWPLHWDQSKKGKYLLINTFINYEPWFSVHKGGPSNNLIKRWHYCVSLKAPFF